MAQLPPEPQSDQPVSAAWARQVIRYLRAITPRSSPTVRLQMGAGGTTFRGASQARAGLQMRCLQFTLTPAGLVPTPEEIVSAISSRYVALELSPRTGDLLVSTGLHYLVFSSFAGVSESEIYRLEFTVADKTYMAVNVGPNRLF